MNKIHAVQLMSQDFSFEEFETDEDNIKNTTEWIISGAIRVWLRNGISVFRIAEGSLPIKYFAVDFSVKPWKSIYCVKVDYSAYIKPLRAACQAGVWKDVNYDINTRGLVTDIFWKILFKNHDMIADTIQTRFGYQFWIGRIQEAFRYNYHVYSLRIKDGKIKEAKEIKTLDQFSRERDTIWGPKITDRFKRIAITLKPIIFATHQKPYGASIMPLRIPKEFQEAPATKTAALATKQKLEINARINMSAEVAGAGLCPDCRKPMSEAYANGHLVLNCPECRIVIPSKDAT